MGYELLADAVVVVHFAFAAFVALGGLMSWRWPKLIWAHLPCAGWGAALVVVGLDCPLTAVERGLRERAGGDLEEGFVARYLEGVLYPEGFTPHLRVAVAIAIAAGWIGLGVRSARLGRVSSPVEG